MPALRPSAVFCKHDLPKKKEKKRKKKKSARRREGASCGARPIHALGGEGHRMHGGPAQREHGGGFRVAEDLAVAPSGP